MAACEQGYLCAVCGQDVEEITDSDLYLRYVLGEVNGDFLHRLPERHIRCNPVLGQFIVADGFEPIEVEGPFAKVHLDPEYVAAEQSASREDISGSGKSRPRTGRSGIIRSRKCVPHGRKYEPA